MWTVRQDDTLLRIMQPGAASKKIAADGISPPAAQSAYVRARPDLHPIEPTVIVSRHRTCAAAGGKKVFDADMPNQPAAQACANRSSAALITLRGAARFILSKPAPPGPNT